MDYNILATVFLDFWQRFQNSLIFRWGMEDFNEKERTRPEFIGFKRQGLYYNGEWINPWAKIDPDQVVARTFRKLIVNNLIDFFEGALPDSREQQSILDLLPEERALIETIHAKEHPYYPFSKRIGRIIISFPFLITMVSKLRNN